MVLVDCLGLVAELANNDGCGLARIGSLYLAEFGFVASRKMHPFETTTTKRWCVFVCRCMYGTVHVLMHKINPATFSNALARKPLANERALECVSVLYMFASSHHRTNELGFDSAFARVRDPNTWRVSRAAAHSADRSRMICPKLSRLYGSRAAKHPACKASTCPHTRDVVKLIMSTLQTHAPHTRTLYVYAVYLCTQHV